MYLFFSLLICYNLSCKKDPKVYYIPQDMKDYVMFSSGSYWVYQDSLTGNIDSVYLIYSKCEVNNGRPEDNADYETILQRFYTSKTNEESVASGTYKGTDPAILEYFSLHGKFIYKLDLQTGDCFSNIKFVGAKDSLMVDGNIYIDVLSFQDEYDQLFYWSKHIGVIKKAKMNQQDSQTWNLIRYYIIY
jgi:hypothetical protein